ncbi:hypothetical protein PZ895_12145, partial [Mesorhizobium sp. YIM 152430]|uniref:hypothetical protein n=1 Tax=Mesorhizobium sp. YIM 152430 TaxID=3031761 RepID=UPI0023DC4358
KPASIEPHESAIGRHNSPPVPSRIMRGRLKSDNAASPRNQIADSVARASDSGKIIFYEPA